MANNAGTAAIYPIGRGHYALGSPDGKKLFPGESITILLAGYQIKGMIHPSECGDYLRAEDGTICGLRACMRVVATVSQEHEAEVAQ